jgi:hypothetical protein
MKELVEGRKNAEAHTAFFDHFVLCATMEMLWDRGITKVVSNFASKKYQSLCTITNEVFALLLLENRYDRWLNFLLKQQGPSYEWHRVKCQGFQSKVPILYMRGGIE